jgi:hypothetical protein
VDFGDGTSAAVSGSTGPITHAFSSAGSHRVTLSCTAGGQSQSVGSVAVGAAGGRTGSRACLRIPPGVVPDMLERVLVQLGFGICRH